MVFAELYRAGRIGLELVPQGTLAERIRAAGAGIPAFYTPTAAGTSLAQGKPLRRFAGRECLLEHALSADVALIKAAAADRHGNLVYNKTARNFAPLMATAAKTTDRTNQRRCGPWIARPRNYRHTRDLRGPRGPDGARPSAAGSCLGAEQAGYDDTDAAGIQTAGRSPVVWPRTYQTAPT